jgi:hypothetical protein
MKYSNNLFRGVVTIGAYGRAGSGLMLSLLDGHSDLINFQDTVLSGYQDWWDSLKSHDGEFVMNDFIDLYQVIFDPSYIHPFRTPPGIGNNFGNYSNLISNNIHVPKDRFINSLTNILSQKENAPDFFKKIHFALAEAIDKKITSKTIILYGATNATPHRLKFIQDANFKEVSNLLMVREPVIGHYAQINHWLDEGEINKDMFLYRALNMMCIYNRNILGWEKNTKAIRLEDLHNTPIETIKKIIKWIGLSYEDSLLYPSFIGKKWQFSENDALKSTFDIERISPSKYNYLLDTQDHLILTNIFKSVYKEWCYEKPKITTKAYKHFFKKFKAEKLFGATKTTIIKTRVLLIIVYLNIYINRSIVQSFFYKFFGVDFINKIKTNLLKKQTNPITSKQIISLLK